MPVHSFLRTATTAALLALVGTSALVSAKGSGDGAGSLTSGSQVGCILSTCLSDHVGSTASVVATVNGDTASVKYTVIQPSGFDIDGVFFDLTGAGLDSSACTITTGAPTITNIGFNTLKIDGRDNINLEGCPRHAFDFAAQVGTQGGGKDVYSTVTVNVKCAGHQLSLQDFAGAWFGARISSVGKGGGASQGGSSKLMCRAPGPDTTGICPVSPPTICPDCPPSPPTVCPTCPSCPAPTVCPPPAPVTCPPNTCGWVAPAFPTTCSASSGNGCGSGTVTRTVTCACNGITVPDGVCTGAKPSTSQSCQDSSKCVTCSWKYSPWSSCTASCSSSTRTATCVKDGCTEPCPAGAACGAQDALSAPCPKMGRRRA